MRSIIVGCDYAAESPFTPSVVDRIWATVRADGGGEARICLLDFDRHGPEWICVEANHPEETEAALEGRYDLVARLAERDRLYRKRGP